MELCTLAITSNKTIFMIISYDMICENCIWEFTSNTLLLLSKNIFGWDIAELAQICLNYSADILLLDLDKMTGRNVDKIKISLCNAGSFDVSASSVMK